MWGEEIDITSEFFSKTSFWNGSESCNNNGNGTYTYNSAAWGGMYHEFNQDWSDYTKVVFEYSTATTTNTQVLVQGTEVKGWANSGSLSIEATLEGKTVSNVTNLALQTQDASSVTIKRIYLVKKDIDPFLNPVSGVSNGTGSKELTNESITTGDFYLSESGQTGVKYVRVMLTDVEDNTLDYSGKLSVEYEGLTAQQATASDNTNGLYLYNGNAGLDLSKLKITLTASTAAELKGYRVKCLLANDLSTATPNNGGSPLTKEPKCNMNIHIGLLILL